MMRRTLYLRIYLHLLAMLAVVAVVTGVVLTSGFRTAYLHGLTERLVRHGANLVADNFQDVGARSRTVNRLARELEVDVTVRDASGRTLSAAGPELPPLDDEAARQVSAGDATVGHHHRTWYAVAPVYDPKTGKILGTVQATPVHKGPGPKLLRPVVFVSLVLLIVAAATGPLARRISRPIERLTEAMRRFGGGELGYRVPVGGGGPGWRRRRRRRRDRGQFDELEQLGASWNEMAERIERLVRGQKELLANVSHELRSPLARIRVALALLPNDAASEARVRDLEQDIVELDRLIEDVLTASRLDAPGLQMHFAAVALGPVMAQIAERARLDPALAGKPVRVIESARVASFLGDATLLKRALWNLVVNAAKYGAAPSAIEARVEGDTLRLSVSDEGTGIPPADRARVLEPFFRADKARTPSASGEPPRGFGLGLTIAKRVAELHLGRIAIGSARSDGEKEIGCRVTMEIPLRAAGE